MLEIAATTMVTIMMEATMRAATAIRMTTITISTMTKATLDSMVQEAEAAVMGIRKTTRSLLATSP